jgi:hypothetical protein
MHEGTLTLRRATGADADSLDRLAELEEAAPLDGEVLVAELDGAVVAAVSVRDGRALADVFKPTAAIVRLLRDRRAHLVTPRRRLTDLRPAIGIG